MSGGGIFLLAIFGLVAVVSISRIISDRKQKKDTQV